MARLGINIDHVATLRNQRDEGYPSVQRAAEISIASGADQVTIHLREDRRHIRDDDLHAIKNVTKRLNCLLNLEVGTDYKIAQIAGDLMPDWVCVVPEKRQEKTTEGGLDLTNNQIKERVLEICKLIKNKSPQTRISLFIEASEEIYQSVLDVNSKVAISAVEIHTGEYAKYYLENKKYDHFIEKFKRFKDLYNSRNIGYHAGHGLTDMSLSPLVRDDIFDEYNIGHWVISESLFYGLGEVVKNLKNIMES